MLSKQHCQYLNLQVSSLLHIAYENRAVAATNCNERSSRSHSVFRLKLTGSNELTGEQCQGKLIVRSTNFSVYFA